MRKTLRQKISFLVALGIIISMLIPMTVSAAETATLPFTWTVGSTVDVSQYRPDGDWNVVKDGSDVYLLYSDYDSKTGPYYKRFKGTSMDDLVEQSAPVLHDFPEGSNSAYWTGKNYSHWLCGINVGTDGKWYALIHSEYAWDFYGSSRTHFRRIGLATSTDKGASWYYKGSVITSDNNDSDIFAYSGKYYDNGPCDQKLFVDSDGGYYYLYYQHNWVDKETSLRYQSMRVARAPISSNMAAGSWTKWYNGSWSEPGLGGRDSDVFMNCDSAVVFYSTYLNKFVAISRNSDEVNGGATCISTCDDMNTQNWTRNQLMTGVNIKWYNRIVDPVTSSVNTIGQNFRIYQSNAEHSARVYTDVSFGSGSTTSSTYDYVYPSELVPDGNSEWGTDSMATTIDTNNIYKITSRWSSKALDVADGSKADGGSIIQWGYNDGSNQKWQFVDLHNGYYNIKNVYTGKCLCIKDQSTNDNALIVQWTQSDELNQQWQVTSVGAGYFKLVNRNSGKVLDLADGSLEDGGKCIQWTDNGGLNQQFAVIPVIADTATAKAATLNPGIGVDNEITMTVKNNQLYVDKDFDGAKDVTITGVKVAADGTYGSFNGVDLDADSAGAGQVISVNFSDGVGKANLKLNKGDAQAIGFSIATVAKPATNTLTITPCKVPPVSYEAESSGNTFAGAVKINDRGMCSGGKDVGDIGNGPENYLTFNNINADAAGKYNMTICYVVSGTRSIDVSVNGDSGVAVSCTGPDWGSVVTQTLAVNLNKGNNTIKIYNNTGYGPDIDRIIVSGEPNIEPQNVSFENPTVDKIYGDGPFSNTIYLKDASGNAITDGGHITYTSSNEDVAAVDENGQVTVHNAGSATITATVEAVDGKWEMGSNSYTVNVEKKALTVKPADMSIYVNDMLPTGSAISLSYAGLIPTENVSLQGDTPAFEIQKADGSTLTDSAIPGKYGIVWTNKENVTVLAANYNITKDDGVLTIRDRSSAPDTELQIVSFENSTVSKVYGDGSFFNTTYIKDVSGSAITDGGQITYTSSNEAVATVDGNGQVTVHNAGSATITATAEAVDGKWEMGSNSYTVNVAKKALTVKPADMSIYVNDALPAVSAIKLSYTGLIPSENVSLQGDTPAFEIQKADGSTLTDSAVTGKYAIVWTNKENVTVSAANYNVTKEDGMLTISSRPSTPDTGGGTHNSSSTTGGTSNQSSTTSGTQNKTSEPVTSEGKTVVTVSVEGKVLGENATAKVDKQSIQSSIGKAVAEAQKKNTQANVEIKINVPKEVTNISTEIPAGELLSIAEGKTDAMNLSTPLVQLSFDKKALATVAESNPDSSVTIKITKIDPQKLSAENQMVIKNRPAFAFTVMNGNTVISNFKGGEVTVALPYNLQENESPDGIVVYYIDDNQKLTKVDGIRYDKVSKKVIFKVSHFSYYAVGYQEPHTFSDVKEGDWFYEAVNYAADNNMMNGTGNNKFEPLSKVSRAMVVKTLYNMDNSPAQANQNPFGDVKQSDWYYTSVLWAKEKGISYGTTASTFSPEENLTREQLAVFLYNYSVMKGYDTSIRGDLSGFKDAPSGWARTAMQWAVGSGIIKGNGEGSLSPHSAATRAELAVIMMNFKKSNQ